MSAPAPEPTLTSKPYTLTEAFDELLHKLARVRAGDYLGEVPSQVARELSLSITHLEDAAIRYARAIAILHAAASAPPEK